MSVSIGGAVEDDVDFDALLRARPRYVNPQRNALPPRTTIWVLLMLLFGTVLVTLGIGQHYDYWFGESDTEVRFGLSMIGLGSFMFIPGSYGTYILYGAYSRWDGFLYSQLPDYGDN